MQNVLITGGAGFIGSHLSKSLLDKGFRLMIVDNLITGDENNISDLLSNPNFKFINMDISDDKLVDYFQDEKINFVFHLASPASPIDYQKYPEETLLANTQGTLNILKIAAKKKSKVLLASTSEIYGDPLEHPQKETYFGNVNTFGPRSCYDESKRLLETLGYIYFTKHKLDLRIVRIFNTFGPKMKKDDGRVVSNFINWALKDETIKIDGDGSQTRSFCFVSDLVEGINLSMFKQGTNGQIINLGNPKEFTILELANLVVKLTNSKSKIVCNNTFRENDPMRRKPDISKANKLLSWEPKVDLKEGLNKTIDYYLKSD